MDKENEALTARIQHKELEMLRELSALLERHGIRYYLACGTALGCVRHRGFIPWDDDVDIYVPGWEYEKLRQVFLREDTGNLALHDPFTVAGYPYTFPKIVAKDTVLVEKDLAHLSYRGGVYIDIFLLEAVSSSAPVRRLQEMRRYWRYCRLRSYYFEFPSPARRMMHGAVRMLCSPERIQKALYRGYTRKTEHPEFVVDVGTFGDQALLRWEMFAEQVSMPYGDTCLQMPSGWEAYLKHYYGDYMQLPPEDQRLSNHDFVTLEIPQKEDLL